MNNKQIRKTLLSTLKIVRKSKEKLDAYKSGK